MPLGQTEIPVPEKLETIPIERRAIGGKSGNHLEFAWIPYSSTRFREMSYWNIKCQFVEMF